MKLKEALLGVEILSSSCNFDEEVSDIVNDSRKAVPGSIFAAVMGAQSGISRLKYARAATDAGAICVLSESKCDADLPFVLVGDVQKAFAKISANIAGNAADKLKLIGITGTNGKTTISHLVRAILEANGTKCGLIGTNEVITGKETLESALTTPEPPELHKYFKMMVDNGCEYCVMEVSSHALAIGRVKGLNYTVAAYTNLSQDHQNFHNGLEEYAAEKAKLFQMAQHSVINIDDSYAEQMIAAAKGSVTTYSVSKRNADLLAMNIQYNPGSIEFEALATGRIQRMKLGIPGKFSVSNALAAIGICDYLGYSFQDISKGLASAQGVSGRAEIVRVDRDYTVMIDYAHTPDSLENILNAVRPFIKGRIITLFGCGGDRDRTKRPKMGRVAEDLSDICIVTSDNPRTEKPIDIINEIVAGMEKENHIVIEDRREAVMHALDIAKAGDLILLAGKGHEKYQEINGVKYPMDEREIVTKHLYGK